nr:glycoside hydrolase family 2 TIM barrel-domain containing protein [uncultured Eisenbergiella sp.]
MEKISFNDNWIYHDGGGGALDALIQKGQNTGKPVTLPHDASVGKPRDGKALNGSGNGFFVEENCHYTKEFWVGEADKDKNVLLEFEGVYQNAFVYINNSFAGQCPYGYGNFYIDATKFIHFGAANRIKVVVKNGVPSGRWYTGGGIYRDVNLMIADRMHFIPDGIHLACVDAETDLAVIRAEAVLEYTGCKTRDVVLELELFDEEGTTVSSDCMPVTVEEHSRNAFRQRLYVKEPRLWNVDTPYLYGYRIRIREGEAVLDEETGSFGIRRLQLDRVHGLRINGETVKLRGGCIHHDNGIIGSAVFAHAEEFRVKKLKEAGYNAVRSSHYPMNRKLLEACDKYGMLVMDEFSDVWTTTKVDFDYGMHMAEWWEHDVTNLVNKDYNHPCVIMYSVGNEIPETGNRFDAVWGKKLADKIRSLDDTRFVTNSVNLMLSIMDRMEDLMAGMAANASPEANDSIAAEESPAADDSIAAGESPAADGSMEGTVEINSAMSNLGELMNQIVAGETAGKATESAFAQVDIAGYNYAACRYEPDGITYPNRIIVGSETYPQDLDVNWELVQKHPYLIGDFSWTAWDYLGEAGIGKISYGQNPGMSFYAEYPYKAAYCGDMNLLGDRRPVSYWREIIWGLRKAPYLAVQPPEHHEEQHYMSSWSMTNAVRSWNWSGYEGRPVTVEVYTDAEEAALYVNGVLLEKKEVGKEKKARVLFETVYTPGILETVVCRDGIETGRDRIVTAACPAMLQAEADRREIPADGSDIAFVEICVADEKGNRNPQADTAVHISVEGPGILLGYGSADPASEENYFDTTARAYEGRLRAAVRGAGREGVITVTLQARGCETITVVLEAV